MEKIPAIKILKVLGKGAFGQVQKIDHAIYGLCARKVIAKKNVYRYNETMDEEIQMNALLHFLSFGRN